MAEAAGELKAPWSEFSYLQLFRLQGLCLVLSVRARCHREGRPERGCALGFNVGEGDPIRRGDEREREFVGIASYP